MYVFFFSKHQLGEYNYNKSSFMARKTSRNVSHDAVLIDFYHLLGIYLIYFNSGNFMHALFEILYSHED